MISSLALGGWLTFGGGVSDAESARILHRAIDGGINFIDLADVYAAGAAERVVGRFLQETDRDRLVISSKVFWPMGENAPDRGLSRHHIHGSIDRTLERLGLQELDIYFCHREDPDTELAETVQAMGDLVTAGKVRAWGTSCWRPATIRKAHQLAAQLGVAPPRVEQPQYNLLERWIESELVPTCQQLAMAVVVFSPLCGGVLTGKYLNGVPAGSRAASSKWLDQYLRPDTHRAVQSLVSWCQSQGLDPAVVALAWVMQQPGITAAISGATSAAQLSNNLQAATLELDAQQRSMLASWFPADRRSLLMRLLAKLRRMVKRS